jgi:hypothetical protein
MCYSCGAASFKYEYWEILWILRNPVNTESIPRKDDSLRYYNQHRFSTGHTLIDEEKKETLKKQPGMDWNWLEWIGMDSNQFKTKQLTSKTGFLNKLKFSL